MRKGFIVIVFLLTFQGFAHSGKWKGRVYEEDGFKVIENYGEGMWGNAIKDRIKLVKTLSIGKEEGKDYEIFSDLIEMAVGPHGEILILDRRQRKLRKFSKDGVFQWERGKKGEGPGEFKYPMSVSVTPEGKIWLVDSGIKIHEFSMDGKFLKSINLPQMIGEFYFLKNGNILASLFVRRRSGIKAAFFNRKWKLLSIFPFEYKYGPEFPAGGGSLSHGKIILSQERIFFILPDKYELLVFSTDAKPILKIKRHVKFLPTKITIVGGGGIQILTRDEIGPAFSVRNKYYVVQFRKIKGREKEDTYETFLDFYTYEGKFLGSYPLLSDADLKWVDSSENFYFFEQEPFPLVYRARLEIKDNFRQ